MEPPLTSVPSRCFLPPRGWYCKKEAGHEGPCPTWPTLWTRLWYFLYHGKAIR